MTLEVDGNVSVAPLPGGHQTSISGLGIYYPDDSKTQRCGVRIDHPVFPTPEGVLAGRDEVLERALQPASAQFPDGRPFAAAPDGSGAAATVSPPAIRITFCTCPVSPQTATIAPIPQATRPSFPRRPRLA